MSTVFDQNTGHDLYEAVMSNGTAQYLLKKSSIGKFRALSKIAFVGSTSATTSVFTQSNVMVSFLLPIGQSNLLDVMERLILQLSITNNSSSAIATLLPVCFQINRFEILAGSQLEVAYSQNLYEDRVFFSKNDEEVVANQPNELYGYANGVYSTSTATLAASASGLYFLELPNFLTRGGVFLKSINQQLTVNVYFNSSGVTSTSASQSISVTQMRLYLQGYSFEDSVRNKLMQRYSQLAHYIFYNNPEWTQITGENISNLSKTNTRCGVFSGKQMTNLMVSVIDNNALQQAQYGYYPLQYIDQKDAGLSLFNDSLYQEIYREMAKQTFMTSAPEVANNYLLPHSTNVYSAVNNCLQLGSYLYNSNIVLELQAVTNIGSKTVLVTGYSACIFKIQAGSITKIYA